MVEPIPDAICEFLWRTVDSVMQLEAVLLLHSTRPRMWTIDAIVSELRVDPAGGRQQLGAMLADGSLVRTGGDADATIGLGPALLNAPQLLDDVERLYTERRVAVVSLIYNKPADRNKPSSDPVQQFADAFRFRQPPRPGGKQNDG